MDSKLERAQKLSSFWIKIIAFATMAIDHIGLFMWQYATSTSDTLYVVGFIFRCIGRLAFPLFVLMLVEGLIHSKNVRQYLLRLAILLGLVMAVQVILYYFVDPSIGNNPFIDLLVNGLFIYFITKKGFKKLWALLPLSFVILSTTVDLLELSSLNLIIKWFPLYLRMGYSIFGFLLTIAFYYSYELASKVMFNHVSTGYIVERSELLNVPQYRSLVNIIMAIALFFLNVVLWFLPYISTSLDLYFADIQTWSIFAGLLIILYNGKRGYDAKWFRITSYAFFPTHIALIYLIFALIFGM
ncbi:MAG: hypothetical protein EOM74_01145 [Methanomicrobia archaeon]|jgi:hypothetical protein|nr:hypothetical protein [Methanomicrobia archaeon]